MPTDPFTRARQLRALYALYDRDDVLSYMALEQLAGWPLKNSRSVIDRFEWSLLKETYLKFARTPFAEALVSEVESDSAAAESSTLLRR